MSGTASTTAGSGLGGFAEKLEQLRRTIERQHSALARVRSTHGDTPRAEAEEKALREAMTHTVAVSALLRHLQRIAASEPAPAAPQGLEAELARQKGLAALARTAEVVNSSLDLEAVLAQVMDTFIGLTGAERGFIMLLDESSGRLKFRTARNLDRETLSGQDFQISRTIVEQVARDGRPVATTNAQADPRFSTQRSVVAYALRSILCAPLRARGRVTGVIYADHRVKSGLFTRTDSEMLVAFADQASVAIENARLHAHVTVARDLMRNVFDSISSGVITVDRADRVTLINRAAERILALSAERVLGRSAGEALGPLGLGLAPLLEQVRGRDLRLLGQELSCPLPGRGLLSLSVDLAPLTNAAGRSDGAVVVLEDQTERRRSEREQALVRRYLPTQLVEHLAGVDDLRLGGARQTVSVFFADIRGFTAFSEKHDPVAVMEAINAYFGLAQNAIHANRGIVDKYMGDAVMAHYNTPLRPDPEHAWAAVRTAWDLRVAIERFRAENPQAAALEFGIGVNTGEAVAGNVGAHDYMEYTLIGDAVNLAKRLQENAGPRQILLGRRSYELVHERVEVVELAPLTVKGRQASEKVYELIGLRG